MKELKEGWKKVKLEKVAKYINTKITTSGLCKKNYISTENMISNRGGVLLSSSIPQNIKVNKFEKKDILFSNIRTYFKKLWKAKFEGGASSDVLILRSLDSKKVINEYLYYALSQEEFFNYTVNTSKGTKMPRGDKDAIMKYEFLIPENTEIQKKIASILSAFDDKIEINNEMNKTLEEMAETFFKRWFIDFDFQNENGEPYKSSGGKMVDSELGEIPEGWEVRELKSVLENRKEKINNQKAKVLSAVNTGELKLSEEYFTKQVFSKDISKYIQVSKYDFAYNPSRINIGSIGIFEEDYIGAVSPIYVVFRAENTYHWYFKYLIKTSNLRKEINSRAFGSVRQSLSYKDFSLIKVAYPSQDIISHFNNIYEILYKNQKKLIKEIQFLTEIRDTLLPKLMSGEVEA